LQDKPAIASAPNATLDISRFSFMVTSPFLVRRVPFRNMASRNFRNPGLLYAFVEW
jgi:hypothetical protein